MVKVGLAPIREIEENIKQFAGEEVSRKVMEGIELLTNASSEELAVWVKGAMGRLDALVDEGTKARIMENCGYSCAVQNRKVIERAVARRKKFDSVDEFLDVEQRKPMRGTRLVREGDILYQYYTPRTFAKSLRCYCSLIRSLPADETISQTYCHCAKGFVKKFWEGVLEKPVDVEFIQSIMSGAQECKFAIHI